jgi:hypothetical protein
MFEFVSVRAGHMALLGFYGPEKCSGSSRDDAVARKDDFL